MTQTPAPVAPEAERIETREIVGEAYGIPLNHGLTRPHACRGDELSAIARWAEAAGVTLRTEATVSLAGGRARVLTYDHKPELQMEAPAPKKYRRFVEEQEIGLS